ncbi:MAG: hypothetical protein LQ352_007242 [Teloschistes flavicans]|nr:MAG: hypothetical protein LQ352_007242 [Teloschistes flavicans]
MSLSSTLPSALPSAPPPTHLDPKPRILLLHGGGTNSVIFRMQCRVLSTHLSSHFRLVYADAPFAPCEPGPDVLSVYKDKGPFRKWLHGADITTHDEAASILSSIDGAMEADDACGGTGEWVAAMGFSQGAKVAASLLLAEQISKERGRGSARGFRFAVLMAGRGPLLRLDSVIEDEGVEGRSSWHGGEEGKLEGRVILRLPTIHVHGLRDPGLDFHRRLMDGWCEEGNMSLVEWEGDHRVVLKTKDVKMVVEAVVILTRKVGVLM